MSTDEESWLELAIEPFRFYLNDVIRELPESLTLDFDYIFNQVKHNRSDRYLSIDLEKVLDPMMEESGRKISRDESEAIYKCYEVQIPENCTIDFQAKELSAPIVINKVKSEIPDDEVLEFVANMAPRYIQVHHVSPESRHHSGIISRQNEIIDLLGFTAQEKPFRTSRSIDKKTNGIGAKVVQIIKEDLWRIKSYDIYVDLCKNISSYINDGNMHALMNITRLKCMTHKGAPIYSMEEIK
jgi:hypothetical protein